MRFFSCYLFVEHLSRKLNELYHLFLTVLWLFKLNKIKFVIRLFKSLIQFVKLISIKFLYQTYLNLFWLLSIFISERVKLFVKAQWKLLSVSIYNIQFRKVFSNLSKEKVVMNSFNFQNVRKNMETIIFFFWIETLFSIAPFYFLLQY